MNTAHSIAALIRRRPFLLPVDYQMKARYDLVESPTNAKNRIFPVFPPSRQTQGGAEMKAGARLAIMECTFFSLLASIIMFSLMGWRQLALFLSAIVAVAGRIALDKYYEYIDGCNSLSAKVSLIPVIILIALSLTVVDFQEHPFLMAALYTLLFVLVIWKIAMLLHWTCPRGKEGRR